MRKHTIAGLLLAIAGHANAADYAFEFKSFVYELMFGWTSVRTEYQPDTTVAGTFSGADIDGDGAIGASELTSLVVEGIDVFNCSGYYSCSLDVFSYRPGQRLELSVSEGYYIPSQYWRSVRYSSVDPNGVFMHWTSDSEYSQYLHDMGFTTFTISQVASVTAVPEPATALLLGAGMGVLGLGRWRHGRRPA